MDQSSEPLLETEHHHVTIQHNDNKYLSPNYVTCGTLNNESKSFGHSSVKEESVESLNSILEVKPINLFSVEMQEFDSSELESQVKPPSPSTPPPSFQWTRSTTLLLLDLIHERRHTFQSQSKKTSAFRYIVDAFRRRGFDQSVENVSRKWNTLLTSYRRNVEKRKRDGGVTWEYFERVAEIVEKSSAEPCLKASSPTLPVHTSPKIPSTPPHTLPSPYNSQRAFTISIPPSTNTSTLPFHSTILTPPPSFPNSMSSTSHCLQAPSSSSLPSIHPITSPSFMPPQTSPSMPPLSPLSSIPSLSTSATPPSTTKKRRMEDWVRESEEKRVRERQEEKREERARERHEENMNAIAGLGNTLTNTLTNVVDQLNRDNERRHRELMQMLTRILTSQNNHHQKFPNS